MTKAHLNDLAIFGAEPAFSKKLYVGRPNIGNRDRLISRIDEMLESRWLSNDGPLVAEFERRIARYVGVKHCIATCNATVAMEIAIRALGLRGEVIVPSFTFIATAHALQWQQVRPVFCDIESSSPLIDPAHIEELITPRTTGIVGVHLWGHICNVASIMEIAARHDLKVLFDAAHAFGCTYRGEKVGRFGDVEVFSFHATKFINSAEGGAVVTNNGELAHKIRLMKNFGFSDYDEVSHVGTNGKMPEVSAAIGLTNLESIDDVLAVNCRNYRKYREELIGFEGVELMTYDEDETCNYQYIVIEIDKEKTKITRDRLMKVLHAENVLVRRYFYPGCHRMEPYKTDFPDAGDKLPNTEKLTERVLTLPTGTAVSAADIEKICGLIKLAIAHGQELSQRIEGGEGHEETVQRKAVLTSPVS
jgi:dTDP-4-amino-4,6-dideoxygalactose transaminase